MKKLSIDTNIITKNNIDDLPHALLCLIKVLYSEGNINLTIDDDVYSIKADDIIDLEVIEKLIYDNYKSKTVTITTFIDNKLVEYVSARSYKDCFWFNPFCKKK